MKKYKSTISKATSYSDIAEFWDTHDVSEIWDKTEKISFDIDIQTEMTYYALDKILSDQIQSLAQKRGVTANTIINLWIKEKLHEQKI